jgi:hypothetical protein
VNAGMRAFIKGSFSSHGMSAPMRRTRSPCCARAKTGHAVAAKSRDELSPSYLRPPETCRQAYSHPERIGTALMAGVDGSSWQLGSPTGAAARRLGRKPDLAVPDLSREPFQCKRGWPNGSNEPQQCEQR